MRAADLESGWHSGPVQLEPGEWEWERSADGSTEEAMTRVQICAGTFPLAFGPPVAKVAAERLQSADLSHYYSAFEQAEPESMNCSGQLFG